YFWVGLLASGLVGLALFDHAWITLGGTLLVAIAGILLMLRPPRRRTAAPGEGGRPAPRPRPHVCAAGARSRHRLRTLPRPGGRAAPSAARRTRRRPRDRPPAAARRGPRARSPRVRSAERPGRFPVPVP